MLKKLFAGSMMLLILTAGYLHGFRLQEPDLAGFVDRFKTALEARNLGLYLQAFSPELRDVEEIRFQNMFTNFGMESASAYIASIRENDPGTATVYLRIFFQDASSVILDLWQMRLTRTDDVWQITEKVIVGNSRKLYKIRIPSARFERVRRFEIEHVDIRITFEDAVCFYDNVPDMETALIVLGKGQLHFTPSHPREQHQLELIFDKKHLDDRLNYAYLRFSNAFFEENVRIVREENPSLPVSEADKNKAYSLYVKHYSRSFTVRSSLTDDLLSIAPQGDEAVFEFSGKKVGDSTYVYSPFSTEEINFYQWKEDRVLSLYSPPLGEEEKRLFISFGNKIDVHRFEIDLDFKPEQLFFAGRARITVETKVGQLESLKFRINPDLEILRISDENNRRLFYTEDKLRKTIYIYFLRPPSRGQTTSIEVYYRGKIEPLAQVADVVTVPQVMERSMRYSWTRFETLMYSRSSLWYPTPDDVDYFDAYLKIITPPRYQVIANGRLKEKYELKSLEDLEDVSKMGNSVHVFETEKPVKYLSFVVGKLDMREESRESVPIQYFRGSQTLPDPWDIFSGAQEIMRFYEGLFGDFPYEKLCIIRRQWVTSGGHSPASFIILNEEPEVAGQPYRMVSNSPVDLSRWREYFLAHEMAHQWWGQGLAWESYRDQWLSEGMSQFAATLFLKEKYGEKAYAQILEKFAEGIQRKAKWGGITMGTRISYFDFKAYQTIVYNKTALVLNMLKDLLGEEVFFTGLRRFFARHIYSVTNTGAFFNAFKDMSAMDLQDFFDKWFNSHLLPEVHVTKQVTRTGEGHRLRLKIAQTGETFIFPLWVEWKQGRRVVRRQIVVNARTLTEEFDIPVKPERIRINPDKAVPGRFIVN